MADVADAGQTEVSFPRTTQYQDIAAPPPTTELIAPTFFAAYAPSWFPPRYPEHPQPFIPPLFETLPSPEITARAYYPDRLQPYLPQHLQPAIPPPFEEAEAPTMGAALFPDYFPPRYPGHPQPVMNIEPVAAPAPDFGQRAIFPDRLSRILAPIEYPFRSYQNLDPIADATVPESRKWAFYPDRLERIRALGEYPQPVMNLEPIPGAATPDFFKANFQDWMLRYPPPFQPPFHYTPTPEAFLVLDDASRGLYQGLRGLYETEASGSNEPYAIALSQGQTIPNISTTDVDLTSVPFATGFFVGSDGDPWGMVDLLNNWITIKHDGYYIVSAVGEWASNNTGLRQVSVFWDGSGTTGQLVRLTYLASQFSGFSAVSPVYALDAGKRIRVQVHQQSGGDLGLASLYLSVVRVSRPRHVLPL